jgi:hypothetical protein
MSFQSEILDGLKELQGDQGTATFNWNDADYPCAFNSLSRGNTPMEGGLWLENDSALFVEKALLPSVPVEGNKITFRGLTLFISRVHDRDSIVKLDLSSTAPPK